MTTSSHMQRLGKDTLLYGLGMALQHFAGFLLFPIYTRVLGKSDVGAQDLLMTTVTITVAILGLGMDAAVGRFYFDAKTPSEQRTVVSTWFVFILLTSLPVTALMIAFAEPISQLLYRNEELAGPLRVALLALPFKLLASCFTLDLRLTFRARQFSWVTGAGTIGQVIGALVFLFWLRMGLTGVFLGILLGTLFQMSAAILLSWRHFRWMLSPGWLWPMLGYGVQLVPVTVSVWLLNSSNRFFLLDSASLNEIALLGAATKIAALITFLITAFQISWGPFSYSLMHQRQQASETYARSL
ncbi:MAG TPA: oligosaccharide flippase family protein, partial [Anaerolineaceae bacterium]|nr:oligosaccharide flippase family protein [Anaerolineaceae bacterium]